MKTNVQNRRGFTLVELLVVIVIIASLAGLTAPMVIRQRKKADQTEAINNVRQIGLALFEFDSDYGSYPGATALGQLDSAAAVVGGTTSSNDYFRMFFQAGITNQESMFYCKVAGSVKPDGKVADATEAVAAKECGFGYATEGTEGYNSSGSPQRPLVMAPLLASGSGATFDPKPFDSNAVFVRGDNSAFSLKIRADGTTLLSGENPFSATATNMWATSTAPTINRPDF